MDKTSADAVPLVLVAATMQAMKAVLVALVVAVGLSGPVSAGPLEDGQAAYKAYDFPTALRLLRPLAEQGNVRAQYNLGVMYINGQGVLPDYVQAHKWLSLAATTGNKTMVSTRNIIAKQMTPAQIAEAQKMVREWKPTTGK